VRQKFVLLEGPKFSIQLGQQICGATNQSPLVGMVGLAQQPAQVGHFVRHIEVESHVDGLIHAALNKSTP
jgi:hypothetical protein